MGSSCCGVLSFSDCCAGGGTSGSPANGISEVVVSSGVEVVSSSGVAVAANGASCSSISQVFLQAILFSIAHLLLRYSFYTIGKLKEELSLSFVIYLGNTTRHVTARSGIYTQRNAQSKLRSHVRERDCLSRDLVGKKD
jgi:hypothetical protein